MHGQGLSQTTASLILFVMGFLIQAAMFLSCLATDINVGLDSWVETDNEKEVNSEQDALNDVLEVLKLELHFSYLDSDHAPTRAH